MIQKELIEDVYPCTPLQEGLIALSIEQAGSYVLQRVLRLPFPSLDVDRFKKAWETVFEENGVLRTRVIYNEARGSLQVVMKDKIEWRTSSSLNTYLEEDQQIKVRYGDRLTRYAIITAAPEEIYFVWTAHHALYDGWSVDLLFERVNLAYSGAVLAKTATFNDFIKYLLSLSSEESDEFWKSELAGVLPVKFPSLPDATHRSRTNASVQHEVRSLPVMKSDITMSTKIRAAWAVVIANYETSDDVVFGATVTGRNAPLAGIEEIVGPTIATIPIRVAVKREKKIPKFLAEVQGRATDMIPYEHKGLQHIRRLSADARNACEFRSLLAIAPMGREDIDQNASTLQNIEIPVTGFHTYAIVLYCSYGAESVKIKVEYDNTVLSERRVQTVMHQFEFVLRQLSSEESGDTVGDLSLFSPQDHRDVLAWNSLQLRKIDALVHQSVEQRVAMQPSAPAVCAWNGNLTYEELDRKSSSLAHLLTDLGVGPEVLVPLCFQKSVWTVVAMLAVLKAGGACVSLDPSHPVDRIRGIVYDVKAHVMLIDPAIGDKLSGMVDNILTINESFIAALPDTASRTSSSTVQPHNTAFVIYTSGSTGKPKGVVLEHASVCTSCEAHGSVLNIGPASRVLQFAAHIFDISLQDMFTTLIRGGCVCIPSEHDRANDLVGAMKMMDVNWAGLTPTVARLLKPSDVPALKTLTLAGEAVSQKVVEIWAHGSTSLNNCYGPAESTIYCSWNANVGKSSSPSNIGRGLSSRLWVVDVVNQNQLAPVGCVGELLIEGPLLARGYLNDLEKTAAKFIEAPAWIKDFPCVETSSDVERRTYQTDGLVRYDTDSTLDYSGQKDSQVKIHGQWPLLARGYLYNPEKTAASFVKNRNWATVGETITRRMYKTGDLVRYNDDGTLDYLCRKDSQVKVHGQRLELGEIEHHLMSENEVASAIVMLPSRGHFHDRLVAITALQKTASLPAAQDPAHELQNNLSQPLKLVESVHQEYLDKEIGQVRTNLSSQLPLYMVPAVWIVVEDIPLNTSRKLDRSKVAEWIHNMDMDTFRRINEAEIEETTSLTKTTTMERRLQQVLARVLNLKVEQILLNKRFLRLGGDSITAMQVVSRAKLEGMSIKVHDVLQSQTISQLALTAKMANRSQNSREDEIDVPFDLSPIQQMYFDIGGQNPYQFNQSFFLRLTRPVKVDEISQAIDTLVRQHAMFRSRFSQATGRWQQRLTNDVNTSYRFKKHGTVDGDEVIGILAATQTCLDIEHGPIFAADVFNLEHGDQLLFISAHHLVIDLVSWRVILEDLEDLLTSGELSTETPFSFQAWCKIMADYGHQNLGITKQLLPYEVLPANLGYWGMEGKPNIFEDGIVTAFSIDSSLTSILLEDCQDALGTEPVEIFLATLLHSFSKVFVDRSTPTVFNEGHGREAWDDADLSRTVGWFTTMAPLHVPIDGTEDVVDVVRMTKDTRRKLPNNGWPYFTSRYLNDQGKEDFSGHLPMELLFNYLGRYQQLERPEGLIQQEPRPNDRNGSAADMSKCAPRLALLEASVVVMHGTANFTMLFNRHMQRQDDVSRWMTEWKNSLCEAGEGLRSMKAERTLSDFPLLPMTYAGLKTLREDRVHQIGLSSFSEIEDIYPSSPMQRGILLSQSKEARHYAIELTFEIVPSRNGPVINIEKFYAAWQQVVDRHAALRTVFIETVLENGALYDQVVLRNIQCPTPMQVCGSDVEAKAFLDKLTPIDHGKSSPLHRLTVCTTSASKVYCKLEINHAIVDAASLGILRRDLVLAYDDLLPQDPKPLYSRYLEYIQKQPREESVAYWRNYLIGIEPSLLPCSVSHGEHVIKTLKSTPVNISVSPDKLRKFTDATGSTVANILQMVWGLVLHAYTGSESICFGYVTSGREIEVEGIESIIGPFVNMLVCRMDLAQTTTVAQTAIKMQSDYANALKHQHVSLAEILHVTKPAGQLFNTAMSIQRISSAPDSAASQPTGISLRDVGSHDPSEYDTIVYGSISDQNDVGVSLSYWNTALTDWQALNIASTFSKAMSMILDNVDGEMLGLDLFSDDNILQVMSWNSSRPESTQKCVHNLIQPSDSIAVSAWDVELTYSELDDLSNRLAAHLIRLGIGRGTKMPLCFEKSGWTIVAMLGVMKAGGAFIPLEPTHPLQRLNYLIQELDAQFILMSPQTRKSCNLEVKTIIEISPEMVQSLPDCYDNTVQFDHEDAMYILFTSGSTGKPKGVVMSHSAVSTSVLGHGKTMNFGQDSRVLQFASYGFDACITEIFTTLVYKGRVCVPSDGQRFNDIVSYMQMAEITLAIFTPSFVKIIKPDEVPSLRTLVLGGEAIKKENIATWANKVQLMNAYGPTETCVICLTRDVTMGDRAETVGKSVSSVSWVVNAKDHNRLAPISCVGELVIEGGIVAKGYLNDREKTAESFIENPTWTQQSAFGSRKRMYKTGDLVRYNENGSLDFLGRKDAQVKLNGQRLELGEIEHHVSADKNIQNVVALMPKTGTYQNRLVAVIEMNPSIFLSLPMAPTSTTHVKIASLNLERMAIASSFTSSMREHISSQLPPYMVPSVWLVVSSLPFNVNDKLDRTKISQWLEEGEKESYEKFVDKISEEQSAGPTTAVERQIQYVISRILNISIEQVFLSHSFLRLGGDSITAMQVVSRAKTQRLTLKVRDILQSQSISQLALLAKETEQSMISRQDDVGKLFDTSPIQKMYFGMARGQPNQFNQSFFLKITQPVEVKQVSNAIEALVRQHSMLRARFVQKDDGSWNQLISKDVTDSYLFRHHESVDLEETKSAMTATHAALNVQTGPLLGVNLFTRADCNSTLYLVAHHLVVDMVSWRVILEDLEDILLSGNLSSERPFPFQSWCNLQAEYSRCLVPSKVLPFPVEPADYHYWGMNNTPNTFGDSMTKTFMINSNVTTQLLGLCLDPLGTEPVELFMATLLHAFKHTFADRELPAVFIEGHGREPWDSSMDLSRTVGWFTTMAPLHISAKASTDLINIIKRVKDARRKLPTNGWSYFTSRFFNEEAKDLFADHMPIELLFNYLGRMQQLERNDSILLQEPLPDGYLTMDVTPDVPRMALFDVSVLIVQGVARCSLTYNGKTLHREAILSWMHLWEQSLYHAVRLLTEMMPEKTLSDFPLLSLTYDSLEKLKVEKLGEVGVSSFEEVEDIYPCSPMQAGLLLSQGMTMGNYEAEFIFEAVPSNGSVNVEKLLSAWQLVNDRHAALRTIFVESVSEEGLFDQIVLKKTTARTSILEIELDDAEAILALKKQQKVDHNERRPPHRFTLCRSAKTDKVFFKFEINHAIIDAASMSVISSDLALAYHNDLAVGSAPRYSEYIRYIQSKSVDVSMEFWKDHLARIKPCHFPVHHDPSMRGRELQTKKVDLDTSSERLQRFCTKNGVTVANIVQVVWGLVLRCYTGSDQICFGYLGSGREIAINGIEGVVGPLINMLVCSLNFEEDISIVQHVKMAQESYLAELEHQHCSLAQIQHKLNLSGSSLFNTLMSVQLSSPASSPMGNIEPAAISFVCVGSHDPTEYDVTVNVAVSNSTVEIKLGYWTPSVSDWQASNLAGTFAQVFQSVLASEGETVTQLEYLSQRDEKQVMEWNYDIPVKIDACVHNIVSARADAQPQDIAICAWDAEFTYAQLDNISTRLAGKLIELGAAPGIVPLCFEKSAWTVVAMLAVLKAGGTCVSIDPSHPLSRNEVILSDVDAKFILASSATVEIFATLDQEVFIVDQAAIDAISDIYKNFSVDVMASDPAFIIYTSGSTGVPKGVVLQHDSFCTSVEAHGSALRIGPGSRVLQFAAHVFDISLQDMFTTLIRGGCVCIPSESDRVNDLAGAINRLKVNWACITPTVAGVLRPSEVPNLKSLTLAGEAVTQKVVDIWSSLAAGLERLNNCYGPAESTIYCAWNGNVGKTDNPNNIGHGLASRLWVVNSANHNQLMPLGCIGELLLEGPLLARGYLNDTEKTAASFIEDPTWAGHEPSGRRMYKTGDLVRYNPDGSLDYLGRKDTQVKMHGQRLELGEIEYHLTADSEVDKAIVIVPNSGPCQGRLVSVIALRRIDASDKVHDVHEQGPQLHELADGSMLLENVPESHEYLSSASDSECNFQLSDASGGKSEFSSKSDSEFSSDESRSTSPQMKSKLASWSVQDSALTIVDARKNKNVAFQMSNSREQLSRKVPSYMLPAIWISVEVIPLNTSGKLDRAQVVRWLEEMDEHTYGRISDPADQEGDVPTTAVEHRLQIILAKVLNIPTERVFMKKSFLTLGGDSITAMQIVSKSRAEGISVRVQDILQSQSISILARSATDSSRSSLSREEAIDTDFELSPVQKMYFDLSEGKQSQFNQSFFLNLKNKIPSDIMANAVDAIVKRHSMLRARFKQIDGHWTQSIKGCADNTYDFQVHDTDLTGIVPVMAKAQKSLNIETGPVFAVNLFNIGHEQMIFLVAHHLVIDMVSWRIVLQNLEEILESGSLLSKKPFPFQTWSNLQTEYARQNILPSQALPFDVALSDYAYWDMEGKPNVYRDTASERFLLPPSVTTMLLGDCNKAMQTEPVELLAASLLHSFKRTFVDRSTPTLFSEGHGRQPWDPEIDLVETVGWFTTISPLSVQVGDDTEIIDTIRYTKDTRRKLPSNGWEYFTSRYLNNANGIKPFDDHMPMEVLFNYLGRYQQFEREGSLFKQATPPGSPPPDVGLGVQRLALFEISVVVIEEIAQFSIVYNRRMKWQPKIKHWMTSWKQTMEKIALQMPTMVSHRTLSDFPLLSTSYSGLEILRGKLQGQVGIGSFSEIEDVYPCSPIQQGLLLSQSVTSKAYEIASVFKVTPAKSNGPVHAQRLLLAWQEVVDRHPILRTVFVDGVSQDGFFNQIVLKTFKADAFERVCTVNDDMVSLLIGQDPMDHRRAKPPHRFTVCQNAEGEVYCKLEINHALTDAASMAILQRDLALAYDGRLPNGNGSSYSNYIKYIQNRPYELAMKFWKEALVGIEPCHFPHLGELDTSDKQLRHISVPLNIIPGRLQEFCNVSSVTVSNVLQTAWGLVLRSYTRSDKVSFGYLTSGREIPVDGIEDAIGPFINMLVCYMDVTSSSNTRQLAKKVQSDYLSALEFQHCSLAQIQHELGLSNQPLFNTIMSVKRSPPQTVSGEDVVESSNISFESVSAYDPTEYDITIHCSASDRDVHVTLSYWSSSLSDWIAENVASSFAKAVNCVLEETISVKDLQCFSDREMHILQEWNADTLIDTSTCVHQLFEQRALIHPSAQAICAWDGDLNYGELDELSTRFAIYLSGAGVGPEVMVPFCFEKSMWAIVTILAVLKAGGACVPLNYTHPPSRLHEIVKDIKAEVLLASPSHVGLFQGVVKRPLAISESFVRGLPAYGTLKSAVKPHNAAFVVYTSGSTGRPKGVIQEHQGICASVLAQGEAMGYSTSSRVLQFAAYTFDVSIGDIFGALFNGGCICVLSDDERTENLAGAIDRMQVNQACLTPTVARMLRPRDVPSLKTLSLGGEQLITKDLELWNEKSGVELINIYGVTEVTVWCMTSHPWREMHGNSKNIGRSFVGSTWIVDPSAHHKLVPVGVVGELVIAGPTVARGYLNDREKTELAFIENPRWLSTQGKTSRLASRVYKTGDLAQYNLDGTINYVGRKDTQVKLHGQRLELGEVEHCLMAGDRVRAGMAMLPKVGPCQQRIVVLLSIQMLGPEKNSNGDLQLVKGSHRKEVESELASIREFMSLRLPAFMVPTVWALVYSIPLNTSGKMDRAQMSRWIDDMDEESFAEIVGLDGDSSGGEPTTAMEIAIQRLWATVLNIQDAAIGIDNNFFQLGGDSISAMSLATAARGAGISLPVATIFRAPKLKDMSSKATQLEDRTVSKTEPFSLLDEGESMEGLLRQVEAEHTISKQILEDAYPCSPLQRGLMLLSIREPGTYMFQGVFRLDTSINIERFRRSWDLAVERHSILRTRIINTETSGSIQLVLRDQPLWGSSSDVEEYLQADKGVLMDYGEPLNRLAIVENTNNRYFVWTIHHAVYDAWTLPLILKDVENLYLQTAPPTPTPPPYANFIAYVMRTNFDAAEDYWRSQLDVTLSSYPPPRSATFQPIADHSVKHEMLLQRPASSEITMSTLIRAAWSLLVSEYTGSDDIVFGALLSGRNAPVDEIALISGPTITTVPVRVSFDRSRSVRDFLSDIQIESANGMPFEHLGLNNIRKLGPEAEKVCDFQNLLLIHPARPSKPSEGFWTEEQISGSGVQEHLTYSLVLDFWLGDGRLDISASFDARVISTEQMQRILHQFEHIIQQLNIEAAGQTVHELEAFSPQDRRDVLEWNGVLPDGLDLCVHDLVTKEAVAHPQAQAISSWDVSFRYDELERLSNSLAHHLVSLGVEPGIYVPMVFEKSAWTIVAMLAVLKAGGAYVSLNPDHPTSRNKLIVADISANVMITSPSYFEEFSTMTARTVCVDALFVESLPYAPERPCHVESKTPAFIVFTSGSTGKPKGIIMEHGAFTTSSKAHAKALHIGSDSRVMQFAAYTYDVSMGEIFTTLMHGGCICVPSEEERLNDLAGAINRMEVNWVFLTPTVAGLLKPTGVPTLKHLVLGGEHATTDNITTWANHVNLINSYGPAECAIWSSCNPGLKVGADPSNLGNRIGGVLWVADVKDHNRLTPIGCVGELLIEGPILARGYHNDTEKTDNAFINNPRWFQDGELGRPQRLYKTGDLVRCNPDGTLSIVGRKDSQIKFHGQRLELGEVEHHLWTGERIKNAMAVMPKTGPCNNKIVAVICFHDLPASDKMAGEIRLVVGEAKSEAISLIANVRKHMSNNIPAYMVPALWIAVESIPLNTSGKMDRSMVAHWVRDMDEETHSMALEVGEETTIMREPSTKMETKLRELWAAALNISTDSIGADHSFLILGGDSISAMRLAAMAKAEGISLTIATVFRLPVLWEMSAAAAPEGHSTTLAKTYEPFSSLGLVDIQGLLDSLVPQVSCDINDIDDILPATDYQAWALASGFLKFRGYMNYFTFHIDGEPNVSRIQESCFRLVAHHPILRTIFAGRQRQLLQVVMKTHQPEFVCYEDLRIDGSRVPISLIQKDMKREVKLDEQVIRFMLVKQEDHQYSLVMRMSHAQYDGISLPIIASDLKAAYTGQKMSAASKYSNFLYPVLDRGFSESEMFWKSLLGSSRMTDVISHNKPAYRNAFNKNSVRTIPITSLSSQGITFATIVKASWSLTLAQLCAESDIVFGQVSTGRNAPVAGIQSVVGPCLNLLPVRVSLSSSKSILQLLQEIQDQHFASLEHENYGFRSIVENCTDWPKWTRFSSIVQHTNLGNEHKLEPSSADFHLQTVAPPFDAADVWIWSQPVGNDSCAVEIGFADSAIPEEFGQHLLEALCVNIHKLCNDVNATVPMPDKKQISEYHIPYSLNNDTAYQPSSNASLRKCKTAEKTVLRAWERVIGSTGGDVSQICDWDTPFFNLWGDLIAAAQLRTIYQEEGLEIKVEDLIEFSSIRQQILLLGGK